MDLEEVRRKVEGFRKRYDDKFGWRPGHGEPRFTKLFLSVLRNEEPIPDCEIDDLVAEARLLPPYKDCGTSDLLILFCHWVKFVRRDHDLGSQLAAFYRPGREPSELYGP